MNNKEICGYSFKVDENKEYQEYIFDNYRPKECVYDYNVQQGFDIDLDSQFKGYSQILSKNNTVKPFPVQTNVPDKKCNSKEKAPVFDINSRNKNDNLNLKDCSYLESFWKLIPERLTVNFQSDSAILARSTAKDIKGKILEKYH